MTLATTTATAKRSNFRQRAESWRRAGLPSGAPESSDIPAPYLRRLRCRRSHRVTATNTPHCVLHRGHRWGPRSDSCQQSHIAPLSRQQKARPLCPSLTAREHLYPRRPQRRSGGSVRVDPPSGRGPCAPWARHRAKLAPRLTDLGCGRHSGPEAVRGTWDVEPGPGQNVAAPAPPPNVLAGVAAACRVVQLLDDQPLLARDESSRE